MRSTTQRNLPRPLPCSVRHPNTTSGAPLKIHSSNGTRLHNPFGSILGSHLMLRCNGSGRPRLLEGIAESQVALAAER